MHETKANPATYDLVIGLLGFEFASANKGCEALSYSFLTILKKLTVGKKVKVYVFLNKPILNIVPDMFPEFDFEGVELRKRNILQLNVKKKLRQCDCVFDVTMGDSFSDIYSKSLCLLNIKYKKLAARYAKHYVLLPQTYGPFEDLNVLLKALQVLEKADLVCFRDHMSDTYLSDYIALPNKLIVSDLAFFLPFNEIDYEDSGKIRLGINVSGLLWNGGFTGQNQFGLQCSYRDYVLGLLNKYCPDPSFEVHLIPHVIKNEYSYSDDDYDVIKKLHEEFPATVLAPAFKDPIEAKSYIRTMDCFVGARMHSTIAAFSTGVATIAFSYSRKFQGLFGDFDYPYVIDGANCDTDECLKQTFSYIADHKKIKEAVGRSRTVIDQKSEMLENAIAQFLRTGQGEDRC